METTQIIEGVRLNAWLFVFVIWVAMVVTWNFGYPQASPLEDVVAAIGFSLFATWAHRKLKN